MNKILFVFAGICASLLCLNGFAQQYPSRAVRVVVAYPPGGGTDVLTRLVARHLGDALGQSIVVENRAGANGKIGAEVVAKAAADGYTLLSVATGPLTEKTLGSFAPISLYAAPSYVLVVNPSVPVASVTDLIALAKAKPGQLAYGSSGNGAASHLATELLKSMAGIDLLHVPYKGMGNAMTDLMGGQIQVMIAPVQAVMPHIRSGKLKALGVTGLERSPALPELPTIAQAGVPGYEAAGWFGVVAPAGTPEGIVASLNREINKVLQRSDMKSQLLELGATPGAMSPVQFLEYIRADNAKWDRLIRERGLVVE